MPVQPKEQPLGFGVDLGFAFLSDPLLLELLGVVDQLSVILVLLHERSKSRISDGLAADRSIGHVSKRQKG